MFPGGRDVILEASRVYELDEFFANLLAGIDGADDLHGLLARVVAISMRSLHQDEHLARMLASEPGEVISDMTVDGLPRIIRVATAYMTPLIDDYLPRGEAMALIDITVRLVISYFLPRATPSTSETKTRHSPSSPRSSPTASAARHRFPKPADHPPNNPPS